MRKLALCTAALALTFLALARPGAELKAAAKPPEKESNHNQKKMVCETVEVTGSLFVERVCRRAEDRDRDAEIGRRRIEEIEEGLAHSRDLINPPTAVSPTPRL